MEKTSLSWKNAMSSQVNSGLIFTYPPVFSSEFTSLFHYLMIAKSLTKISI